MVLKLNIDNETLSWIEKKGAHLTVKTLKAGGCCGGGPIELATEIGKPDERQFFEEIAFDRITIYVQKGINAKDDQLTIKLSGFGIFKYITAIGISRF
ncbi:CC/Se motif family (seleno)protein [Anaerobacillus isosaccharinicus]|uniref:Fe-S oxidoreductase n=1 Tax=Anaerobacillus isosaccharinicus TaxID=1532552 RepID=A0A1S2MCW1_9BACI|nr:CC/Se motif family (seleno)protein [Anaerobacillus isosaccharinicus]MBA5586312.1 Fe-S oxidoreductase [Anaerobacillus isosaccharinicus]QOY35438.1 Fe-S oxidoreductase [Anaerobacillus isosaccharinicus]